MTQTAFTASGMEKTRQDRLLLHVIFNNIPYKEGMTTGWGFSCLIEGLEKTVLFDTGGDGDILLSNMRQLGLKPDAVDVLVLSHIHGDHTGGVDAFLTQNPNVTVYIPASFPSSFQKEVKQHGARIKTISGPEHLFSRVYTTGELGSYIKEQALIIDTPRGLVVMTGCAHPNIADMAEQAHTYLGKNIYLLLGGFHLGASSQAEITTIIARLKKMGVKKVAPSHCTGDTAIRMFRDAWRQDFIEGGLGAVIEVPLK